MVGRPNPGLQFANAAPNGGSAQAGDLRYGNNATASLAEGQQSGEQAPLAFIERGDDAVNGFVVPRDLVNQSSGAMGTMALGNRLTRL